MQRAREKLVAGLAWLFTRLAIAVAPKPLAPPKQRWDVTIDSNDPAVFHIMFMPGDPGEWHVAILCEFTGFDPILVDAGIGRCWLTPFKARHAVRIVRALKPQYLVKVTADASGWMNHVTIGPVTCVTLAKRLLGVHNPGVVTSRQLLDVLWRYRDGDG